MTEPTRTAWIPLSILGRDPRVNTRPVDNQWVEQHVAAFNPDALGVLSVSARAGGETIILDGQNRAELCRRVGWADQSVLCRIYEGLTIEAEARLFQALNDGRAVKPVYKFLARVTEGEPVAVAIKSVAEQLGWQVSDQPGASHINAVVALEKVYTGDRRTDSPDVGAVFTTLNLVTEAWGHRAEAVAGAILLGVGQVVGRYGDQVQLKELARKLASYPGGPGGLLGDARGLRQYQGGSVANCVSEVIVKRYNERRRAHRLPDWRQA
ncbi:DUF6551 family protein [Actinomadura sp. KC216]|uniref:DUF6551 family protein n=1 Tax=Actinomadura sp. KC216 TaxID=2530370 RepID=UPI0014043C4B|nr:DUF6551 family protein [Actinomadura sp. KC216]